MAKNPLGLFADEHSAEDVASATSAGATPYKIPMGASPSSIDPGERALAGLAAVAGSTAAWAVPFLGRVLAQPVLESGSVRWGMPGIQDASSFREIQQRLRTEISPAARSRPLGLFGIKARPHPVEAAATKAGIRPRDVTKIEKELLERASLSSSKLDEMQHLVDGFIDKNKLKQKGVRISMSSGPLSGLGGGRYEIPTKRVTLPRVGKELALHELGHAADYTSGRLGKIRGWTEGALHKGVLLSLPIALAAGDEIKAMIPGTIDDRAIEFMQDNAPEIMAATLAVTTLIPEAKASFLAVKHIKQVEGAAAGRKAAAKFLPLWGTHLLGAIPAVIGMALARKYMRGAREDKSYVDDEIAKLEKTSGMVREFVEGAKDIGHVAKELGIGTATLFKDPGTLRRIGRAAKATGQSPEFLWGAVGAAVPATLGALYMYGTPGGKVIRDRMHPETRDVLLGHSRNPAVLATADNESWRERNPAMFAGLVAAGAALSGGILSKFLHDVTRVL